MSLSFVKMHSLGNDFMMIDSVNRKVSLSSDSIIKLADRHRGVGFDQCILVEPSDTKDIDFFYRIFNSNGQEIGQCGNGARCLAHYINYKGLSSKKKLRVKTLTTQMNLQINEDQSITVEMEQPKFKPEEIPFSTNCYQVPFPLWVPRNASSYPIYLVNVGNPHAVILVNNLDNLAIDEIGQEISEHSHFPQQTNVGFMEVINADLIQLRVYERGCGETYACGSGAVAAVAIGRLYAGLATDVRVKLLGGELHVAWPDTQGPIYLQGPSTLVYEAVLNSDFIG